jgi:hypothetical protein
MAGTVAFIIALTSQVLAIDKNGRYFAYGLGQRNCEDYVKFREKRLEKLEADARYTKDELYEIATSVVEQWLAGFLTAHNLYVTDTYDVAGKVTMDDLTARVEKSCRANPKQYFSEAVVRVAHELNQNRVKTEPRK